MASRKLLKGGFIPVGGSDAHYAGEVGESINLIPFKHDVENSIRSLFRGESSHIVLGSPQSSEQPGRQYARIYYKIKPYIRVPRAFVPVATMIYRFYINNSARLRKPVYEVKHGNPEAYP